MLCVADYANDRSQGTIRDELDLLAKRILARPIPLRHELIDNDDRRRINLILVVEEPALEERDAERCKVVGHRRIEHDFGFLAFGWRFPIGKGYGDSTAIAAERQTTNQ